MPGPLGRGVVLGPEHPAGRYDLYGVFSRVPLDRRAVRLRIEGGRGDAVVLERHFDVR